MSEISMDDLNLQITLYSVVVVPAIWSTWLLLDIRETTLHASFAAFHGSTKWHPTGLDFSGIPTLIYELIRSFLLAQFA